MPAANGRLRDTLSRYALGLWFSGIAALGLLRCWMKIVREGQGAPWPLDVWPWFAGTALCAAAGICLLLRERRRHALQRVGQSAPGAPAS